MNLNLKRGILVTGVIGAITASAYYNALHSANDLSNTTLTASANTIDSTTTDTNNDSPFADNSWMQNTTKDKSLEPKIGDTEQQVIDSSWGNTADKTTTKDSYGTSAMWFYDNGRSIFFIDGKVNSITE
jgi:hypothetical protein